MVISTGPSLNHQKCTEEKGRRQLGTNRKTAGQQYCLPLCSRFVRETWKNFLQTPKHKVNNIVYAGQCSEACSYLSIRETKLQKNPTNTWAQDSSLSLHLKDNGQSFEDANVDILDRDDRLFERRVKTPIYIPCKRPSLTPLPEHSLEIPSQVLKPPSTLSLDSGDFSSSHGLSQDHTVISPITPGDSEDFTLFSHLDDVITHMINNWLMTISMAHNTH